MFIFLSGSVFHVHVFKVGSDFHVFFVYLRWVVRLTRPCVQPPHPHRVVRKHHCLTALPPESHHALLQMRHQGAALKTEVGYTRTHTHARTTYARLHDEDKITTKYRYGKPPIEVTAQCGN